MNVNDSLSTLESAIADGGAGQPSAREIYEQRKLYGRANANLGEISQYNVEHLITLPVERKDGLLTVEDAVRKLKLLDARGKIWTQEALMQVDEKAVKLFDQNTQEELEHFPLTSIQHTQAVLDGDPFFLVAIVAKDSDQKTPDIHLFNSPVVPADVVTADIESALTDCKDKKGRKIRPETLRRTREKVQASVIPPPPLDPPPAPPLKDGVREKVAAWMNIGQASEIQVSSTDVGEESPEVIVLRVNRDVQILNHTLDDIEDFVSKLQKSAEAMKELNARRANKKYNKMKKKMAGDGMLTLRSKLPLQPKFIECFRKFKFAFNLLAKLKTHIQNPNAVEIVHFLFAPLEMCVRACGGYDTPRSVESPLPTRDAIELLTNCTTTHEKELWVSLGDFWTKSRLEFPKEHYFPPYVPQFSSGWEPPILRQATDGAEDRTAELAAAIAVQANRVSKAEEARKMSDANESKTAAFKMHVENHVARNQTVNNTQPSTRMCRSMYDFVGRNNSELNVTRDELLEVLESGKAWWKVKNREGTMGYVPGNQMVLISSSKSPASSNSDGGSYTNGMTNITSSLPSSPVSPNPPPIYSQQIKQAAIVVPMPPPPPPPVPAPVKKSETKVPYNANINNNKGVAVEPKQPTAITSKPTPDKLQEELRRRVNTQQAQQRNFSIAKKSASTSSQKLTNDSTSSEVKNWLKSRAFSQLTVDSLGVLNGEQLFTLSKEELKLVCEEEGARVFSQLQVQKSMSNSNSNESEFDRIMKIRMQKIEGS